MKLQALYQPRSIILTLMLILITTTATIREVILPATVIAVIVSVAEAMKKVVDEVTHLFLSENILVKDLAQC